MAVGFCAPNNELADALCGSFAGELHVIGDALSPRFIESASVEGWRAGTRC